MLAKLSKREKILISILAGMVFVMGFYQFFWQYYYPRYLSLKDLLSSEEANLNRAVNIAGAWEELDNKRREVDAKLAAAKLRFTTDLRGGLPVVDVGRRLEDVQLISLQPGAIIEDAGYLALPLELSIKGTYLEILDFIQAMESLPQAMTIQALDLNAAKEGEELVPSEDLEVRADLKLTFFGLKDGPINKLSGLSGDWAVGRLDIFAPALQELVDAAKQPSQSKTTQPDGGTQAKPPGSGAQTPPASGGGRAEPPPAVLPPERPKESIPKDTQEPDADPYALPIR